MYSKTLLKIIGTIWLWTEIGQFFEQRLHFDNEQLFWPFWLCLVLVIILAVYIIDLKHADLKRATLQIQGNRK